MSLDLLAELDDLDGGDEEEVDELPVANGLKRTHDDMEGEGEGGDEDMSDDDEEAEARKKNLEAQLTEKLKGADDVKTVAKLLNSKNFQETLKKMEHFKSIPRLPEHNTGPVEDDPEYKLIVHANNLISDIDSEVLVVHKFLRDQYAPRFPELEQLVPSPYDFARAIKAIGTEPDVTKADLRAVLPPATVMIISVTATTTNGKPLPSEKLQKIFEAVDMLVALEDAKRKIYEYVESRMAFLAPNMTILVGASTAAKLMGAAGGLTALSKIPASNLQVIGANKKTNTGLSVLGQERHRGFIYYSDLVLDVPAEFKMKTTRVLAAKCTLAARIDAVREAADGHQGQRLREEVEKKIEKMLEPPPGKSIKPLAAPIERTSKKRGGRRVRKIKQQYVMTEVRKAANRMAFNVAEDEALYMDSTEGLGTLGNTGKVRMNADERVKVKVNEKKHKLLKVPSTSKPTSGLASSIAFTPVQGIELANPQANEERLKQLNDKYFSGFQSYIKVGSGTLPGSTSSAPPGSMGPPPPRPPAAAAPSNAMGPRPPRPPKPA
ncbi:hypothetical protein DFJ74DRAFT_663352 [Hyaloraphidium curvatum]|nr:hypothetical protein DFJ74DRAFT_663352 [Hyaloraphidium curvatum]